MSTYSAAWTDRLRPAGVKTSMDGKGRLPEKIFVERLWRSLKHECVLARTLSGINEVGSWHTAAVPLRGVATGVGSIADIGAQVSVPNTRPSPASAYILTRAPFAGIAAPWG